MSYLEVLDFLRVDRVAALPTVTGLEVSVREVEVQKKSVFKDLGVMKTAFLSVRTGKVFILFAKAS